MVEEEDEDEDEMEEDHKAEAETEVEVLDDEVAFDDVAFGNEEEEEEEDDDEDDDDDEADVDAVGLTFEATFFFLWLFFKGASKAGTDAVADADDK